MVKDEEGNKLWRPTLKQERFLQIPLTVKEGFYAGAVNAGKSDVLLMYPICHSWYKHPEFKGLFLRRTMPELRNEIIPRSRTYFEPLGGKYSKSDNCWGFPSGALYFMGHLEHEDDVHKYDSMQPNYVAFDELTSFTEWMYLYIVIERIRVRKDLEGILPMIARSGSNPGNIGHPFVYKRFIKPFPEGGKILVGKGGIKRLYIPATIDDNPYASEQYKRELDALPEAERKAKKGGDWTAFEGSVFDEFRDRKYPDEPDNAIHVIEPFEIPDWWPRIVAIDWGFSAMCSIGFAAISPDRKIYIYRHLMFYATKITEWAVQVKFFIEKENPSDVVICHSANQHRGEPNTILEQVTEALGIAVRLGEKDRISGKTLIHNFLRWKKRVLPINDIEPFDNELAMWILRAKGDKHYQKYLSAYQPVEEDDRGIPRFQFFNSPDVKVIWDTIKACVYQKSEKSGKKKEDVQEFDGDDPYDMLRMLAHAADTFVTTAVEQQERLDKLSEVVEGLKVTGDWTTYYRNMRQVEDVLSVKSVKLFHARRRFH